jgi:hypothetical protein
MDGKTATSSPPHPFRGLFLFKDLDPIRSIPEQPSLIQALFSILLTAHGSMLAANSSSFRFVIFLGTIQFRYHITVSS